MFDYFPRLKERRNTQGRQHVGRRAADAHHVPLAAGQSARDADRRAHRRAGAEDRRAGGRMHPRHAPQGPVGGAGGAEARHCAEGVHARVRDGARPHRVRRHAAGADAPNAGWSPSGWRSDAGRPSSLHRSISSFHRRHTTWQAPRQGHHFLRGHGLGAHADHVRAPGAHARPDRRAVDRGGRGRRRHPAPARARPGTAGLRPTRRCSTSSCRASRPRPTR
jgi:hypothetical protein